MCDSEIPYPVRTQFRNALTLERPPTALAVQKDFFKQLSLLTAFTVGCLISLHYLVPEARAHAAFAAGCVVLFVAISVALYLAGASAARSENKYAFTNLISLSVFGKMAAALAFLFLYRKVAKPENIWFVGIFLFCYALYTVFEVVFMSRLAKKA